MRNSKKTVINCLVLITLLCIAMFSTNFIHASTYADNFNPGAPWVLNWSDEFNGTTLDLSKWQYETGVDFGTGEIEYMTDRTQNVFVQNGALNLKLIRESYGGKSLTSGRIRSYGRFATRYGKVAAKIKMPAGYGVWPAFWMLGNNYQSRTWPKCGELDITEVRGGEDNTTMSTSHWFTTAQADSGNSYTFSQSLSSDWHVYEMNWSPTTITYYFDGNQVSSISIGDPSGSNCFNFPFFILFDLAAGGRFWNPAITDASQVTASLPQTLQVDWVRVYNDSTLSLPTSPAATQPLAIYTETHPGLSAASRGAQLYLWENTCTMTTVAPGSGGEGSQCYQINIGNIGWMGLGIAAPITGGDNLSTYKNSYLTFKIKTTAACGFKAGIECGGIQKYVTLSSAYGYVNDGQWHTIRIPFADLAGLDFSMVTEYLVFMSANATTTGNVVSLDDIYWTANNDIFPIPAVAGGQEIVINSQSHSGYNVLSNGASVDARENSVTLNTSDTSAAHEGTTGWKVTVGSAGWFGFGVSTKARDLSAFQNSTIKFDIKSTAASQIKASMQSAEGYDCYYNLSKFGYVNDGQWHTISIPCNQMYINFSQISQYLMFLNDGASTANDVFDIDNVYITAGTNTTPTPTPITTTPTPTSTPTPTPTPTSTPSSTSAFNQIEAENYSSQSGVQTETTSDTGGGLDVGWIENGDYTVYSNIDFGNGASSFNARVASATAGGNIEIHLDSLTGPLVGTCAVAGTGGWQTWVTNSCSISGASGVHNLYLKYTGGSGSLLNCNWFKFVAGSTPTPTSTSTPTPTPTSTSTPTPITTTPTPTPSAGNLPSTTWYLFNQSVSGVTPAGQDLQTTLSTTTGWQPTTTITTTAKYWYSTALNGTYKAGNWSFVLWTNNPGSSSTVKVDLYQVSTTGSGAVLLGSQTIEAGTSGGGNHSTTFTFSNLAAATFSNQLLLVKITKATGADLTMAYNTNDFPTRLVTP